MFLMKEKNGRNNDKIFNLLGREKMGIVVMTFDSESMKVIYKNNQMSFFENQTL